MSEEIKVDEIKYYSFLNSVNNYIQITSELVQDQSLKDEEEWIRKYIEKELKIRELITARDQNYKFYVLTKNKNINAANAAYQNYISVKAELEKLRKGNT